MRTANCHREKGMEHKGVSFGRTMMQALELPWLAKMHVSGRKNID